MRELTLTNTKPLDEINDRMMELMNACHTVTGNGIIKTGDKELDHQLGGQFDEILALMDKAYDNVEKARNVIRELKLTVEDEARVRGVKPQ